MGVGRWGKDKAKCTILTIFTCMRCTVITVIHPQNFLSVAFWASPAPCGEPGDWEGCKADTEPWSLHFSLSWVVFSHSVVSNSLRPRGLQHIRLSCPSPSPGAWSNSRPLNRWCQPTLLSSVIPFYSHPQSFPASGSYLMSRLFSETTPQSNIKTKYRYINFSLGLFMSSFCLIIF